MNTIRILTLFLLIIWILYWRIEEVRAHKIKMRTQKATLHVILERLLSYLTGVFLFAQLLGLNILPLGLSHRSGVMVAQVSGFIFVILGFVISFSARVTLSSNWSGGYEYQIKQDHELITQGIYRYIRHPIYFGIILLVIGVELVVGSWLWIPAFIITPWVMISWAKREEKLLTQHFGQKYKDYMQKTKRLIPFLF